jgi:ribonucleoside-diphosphate reductase beta chain
MRDTLPLRLFHKSKELFWDPRSVDLSQDKHDWRERMSERERDVILRLSTMFLGGEEAVTQDLAPMLIALRRQGDLLDEEIFLTAQLFEESKHVEWFDRWMDDVAFPVQRDGIAIGKAYAELFHVQLPSALNRLIGDDCSPIAHVEALVTYHIIVEGVLAETGYRGYVRALKQNGLMPGTIQGVELIQRDEARHIAYGLYALIRWLKQDRKLWGTAQNKLNALLALAFDIIAETFEPYGGDIPFGLDPTEFVLYASEQFDHRMSALERGMNDAID